MSVWQYLRDEEREAFKAFLARAKNSLRQAQEDRCSLSKGMVIALAANSIMQQVDFLAKERAAGRKLDYVELPTLPAPDPQL